MKKQLIYAVNDATPTDVLDIIRDKSSLCYKWSVYQVAVTWGPHGKGYGVIVFEREVTQDELVHIKP